MDGRRPLSKEPSLDFQATLEADRESGSGYQIGMTYSAVTFAPVQSFIRASRKLRDLYGSSLLLSHLARAIADDATQCGHTVISPASVISSRGVPNVLVIRGDYHKAQARDALHGCWKGVLSACRAWLEQQLPAETFDWQSSWSACANHSWELFYGQGYTIERAREVLAVHKQQRDWNVPNWTGESSTLSSAEAVVWPQMGAVRDPRELPAGFTTEQAKRFLVQLRDHPWLGEAFAGLNEEISLSELVKRLVTYSVVASKAFATPQDPEPNLATLLPKQFSSTSTRTSDGGDSQAVVWFMADGDGIGDHLMAMKNTLSTANLTDSKTDAEEIALSQFSHSMRSWAASLYSLIPEQLPNKATLVYAGGDDVFGALHETSASRNDLFPDDLWTFLRQFPAIWAQCGQENLTVSMGLVWADAKVPQREALQHARDAEASAKARGKNRFALRLLYANGNHLEWTCPWPWLDPILSHYTDREGRKKWRHLAEDLQWLKSRQAIAHTSAKDERASKATARALWSSYFPGLELPSASPGTPGLDGEELRFRATANQPEKNRAFDQWLLDLGLVMAGLEKYRPDGGVRP